MLRIAIIFGVLLGIVAWAANPHACRPAIQGEQTALNACGATACAAPDSHEMSRESATAVSTVAKSVLTQRAPMPMSVLNTSDTMPFSSSSGLAIGISLITTTQPTGTTYATTAYANVIPTGSISVTGYITTEDDFASGKGADTAYMINMSKMAASRLGITRQGTDGKWVFYYFSGTFSGSAKVNGVWTFNGTGAQLDAFNLVLAQYNKVQMAPVPATAVGVLKGDTATNTGIDADGFYFSVITVTSITAG